MKCAYHGCLVIGQLICFSLQSQYYFSANNKPEPELLWELGASIGVMNCLTDIGGKNGAGKKFIKDINWNHTQLGGGIFLSATWQSLFALRLGVLAGQVNASDEVLKNSDGIARNRYLRNLHFRSNIIELTVMSELHPLALRSSETNLPLFSPYLAGGIGLFSFNPQARLNNTWVDLRPLHTEGQGFTEYPDRSLYKPTSWCIPLGAGIKYDAAGLVNIRFEICYRITGTDYLDDVSRQYIDPALFSKYLSATGAGLASKLADRSAEIPGGQKNNSNAIRGNPSNKDAFFSGLLKISLALGRIQRKQVW
ncbi:MAG: hypothetical protein ABIQ88_12255 [Chitinophagaceae bacterium]